MPNFEMEKQAAFEEMMGKVAGDDIYTEKPSWSDSLTAYTRATRAKKGGIGQFIYDPDVITTNLIGVGKGAAVGTPIGAALGTGAGALVSALSKGKLGMKRSAIIGAAAGGLGGMGIGADVGMYRSQKKQLLKRGIQRKGIGGLFGMVRMTPEAKKKYLGED